MRILIACEFSGTVRDAFRDAGHDAWSCDLLPTEGKYTAHHITGDVYPHLRWGWDMMIAFPPCTHLAVSGAKWFAQKQVEQQQAIHFVEELWAAPIPRIAIENPIGILSTRSTLGKPTQIIQPWQFGHPEAKATCLWLKDLPKLMPTQILPLPESGRWANQTPSGQNKLGPSPDRWKLRSITYSGIAEAMVKQWG